jgi:hypothetical protein
MGCLKTALESALRSDVTTRIIMNLFMIFSDTDVVFSILFMINLQKVGGIYTFLLIFCILGVCVYFVGVLYFGPNQKYKTVRAIQDMMITDQDLFKGTINHREIVATPETPIGREGHQTRIKHLECEADHRFMLGEFLNNSGMSHIWIMAEKKNLFNCMEMVHGIPLIRMARFGFMAVPQPRDFGGLLNANAMYSFCTGVPQLCVSILCAALGVMPIDTMLILPLSVASTSMVLSIINVLFNFPGVLAEVEGERAELARIRSKLDSDHRNAVLKAETAMKQKKDQLESSYKGKEMGPKELDEKQRAIQDMMAEYNKERRDLEKNEVILISDEIMFFRSRLQACKDALSRTGKHSLTQDGKKGATAKMEAELAPWQTKLDEMESQKPVAVQALDTASPTFADDAARIEGPIVCTRHREFITTQRGQRFRSDWP